MPTHTKRKKNHHTVRGEGSPWWQGGPTCNPTYRVCNPTYSLCTVFLVWAFALTYQRYWMYWHLGRTSKHSNSIEHAPKSNPTPSSPTELTTKARASMSFGNRRMLRSSRVRLVDTTCWARCWSWLSWTQWQSSNICRRRWKAESAKKKTREQHSVKSDHRLVVFYLRACQGVAVTQFIEQFENEGLSF